MPIPEFDCLEDYNKQLLEKLDRDMCRDHYKGIGRIDELFATDTMSFGKLPEIPYEVVKYEYAKADNYGKVKFNTKIYSTSPKYAGKQVMLKVGAFDVEIMDMDYNHVIVHKRLYGSQNESMLWLPYLELLSKRPTALKYSGLLKELPSSLQSYLDSCDYDKKKEVLKIFSKMSSDTGMDNAIVAFETTLSYGRADADSIWSTYLRLTSEILPEVDIKVPETAPFISGYIPDIQQYDELIAPRGIY